MVKNNIMIKKVSQYFLFKASITVKNKYKDLNSNILRRKRKKMESYINYTIKIVTNS
jgi:hypothetical protein